MNFMNKLYNGYRVFIELIVSEKTKHFTPRFRLLRSTGNDILTTSPGVGRSCGILAQSFYGHIETDQTYPDIFFLAAGSPSVQTYP